MIQFQYLHVKKDEVRQFSLPTMMVLLITTSTLLFSQPPAIAEDEVAPKNTSASAIASSKMKLVKTITGNIAPKSVRASSSGVISAHNMMYRHSVTLYDATRMELIATVPDAVIPSEFGFRKFTAPLKGAPVEGAYSPDNKYLYVSNYAMYGKGFNKEGTDKCSPRDGYDWSFLYRINLTTNSIDAIYRAGSVPKVVEVTPDNKYLLSTTWCSYDLSVISLDSGKVVKRIPIGAYPRGIAVTKDSQFAYIAQMGGSVVHKVDLNDFTKRQISIGANPRALQLSSDERYLFATLNVSGQVVALDLESERVIKRIKTGQAARSLALSTDGAALFVVNYNSDTLAKVRVEDFKVIQKIKVCDRPIGVTFEQREQRTWVACYGGALKVFSN